MRLPKAAERESMSLSDSSAEPAASPPPARLRLSLRFAGAADCFTAGAVTAAATWPCWPGAAIVSTAMAGPPVGCRDMYNIHLHAKRTHFPSPSHTGRGVGWGVRRRGARGRQPRQVCGIVDAAEVVGLLLAVQLAADIIAGGDEGSVHTGLWPVTSAHALSSPGGETRAGQEGRSACLGC